MMIDDGLDYPNDIIKYVLQVVFRGYVFLWSFSKGMLVSRCEFKMTDRNEVKQMGEGFMKVSKLKMPYYIIFCSMLKVRQRFCQYVKLWNRIISDDFDKVLVD